MIGKNPDEEKDIRAVNGLDTSALYTPYASASYTLCPHWIHITVASLASPDHSFSLFDGISADNHMDDNLFSIQLHDATMEEWLIDEDDEYLSDKEEIGRGGVLTDAHMTFFDGKYTLIVSVVFGMEASRWFPALLTVVDRVNTEAYERHFDKLFKVFEKSSLSLEESLQRAVFVLDYSQAQLAGLRHSFTKFYVSHQENRDVDRKKLETDAAELFTTRVKGCKRHYDISVSQICKGDKIPREDREEFRRIANHLMKVKTMEEAIAIREELMQRWPACRTWLEWWTAPRVFMIASEAANGMDEATRRSCPDDSNAVEGQHKLLIEGAGGKKHSLFKGIEHLTDTITNLKQIYSDTRKFSSPFSRRFLVSLIHYL